MGQGHSIDTWGPPVAAVLASAPGGAGGQARRAAALASAPGGAGGQARPRCLRQAAFPQGGPWSRASLTQAMMYHKQAKLAKVSPCFPSGS